MEGGPAMRGCARSIRRAVGKEGLPWEKPGRPCGQLAAETWMHRQEGMGEQQNLQVGT